MVNIDRHVGVATKTKENKYDGSYECHTKDPIGSAEEHLEFKNLCWIERDRVENENVRRTTIDPNTVHSRNAHSANQFPRCPDCEYLDPLITDRA
jgi:hypothetical protein